MATVKNALFLGLLFFSIQSQAECCHTPRPIIQTESGKLQGKHVRGLWVFRGIPYAAPPIGDRRWKEPADPESWGDSILQATKPGSVCVQAKTSPKPRIIGSEDCLQLDVWSPKLDGNLPVMVFIHGGGFISGSNEENVIFGNLYNGTSLVKRGDVLVVTIKYRLGAFGFLAHPDLSSKSLDGVSGNYGILDQIAALTWVQKNIRAFGGDPSRVTVFGESAGAASTLILMSSPKAKGLFSQAIVESGYMTPETKDQAYDVGRKLSDQLKCTGAETIQCMRAVPATSLALATSALFNDATDPFLPYPDGKVLPRPVLETFQKGLQNKVPFILGTNSNEASDLIQQFYSKKVRTDEELGAAVTASQGESFWNAVKESYSSQNYGTAEQALIQLVTDLVFTCPGRQILKTVQGYSAWQYLFSRVSHSIFVHHYGAGHALELPYVFHFVPAGPLLFGYTRAERHLSDTIEDYWTRFATSGNPNDKGYSKIVHTIWPTYDRATAQYLNLDAPHFDMPLESGNSFRANRCNVIDQAPRNPGSNFLKN